MRWVAETHGWDAVQDLRDGVSLEAVAGLALVEAEGAWLAAVEAKGIASQPCLEAVPRGSPLYGLCDELDPDM